MVSQNLVFKYPWLESAKKVLADDFPNLVIPLDEMLKNNSPLIEAILPRVRSIIQDGLCAARILE